MQRGRNPYGRNSNTGHGSSWSGSGGKQQSTDLATEIAELTEAVAAGLFALVVWLVSHPVVLAIVGGCGVWVWWWGWTSLAVAAGAASVAGAGWRWLSPGSFDRWVWRHLRAGVLRLVLYGPRWPRWARACRLVLDDPAIAADPLVPRLRSVRSGASWDEITVRMLPGQKQDDYEAAAESLAQTRKVQRCAVREVSPGVVSLGFLRRDPLAETVSLPEIPSVPGDEVNLDKVHIGQTEHGESWRVPLLGAHLFAAGMPGAGKGSIMWGVIRQVAPAIASGRVRISMIDPKGGMEAESGAALYHAYARDEPQDIVDVLTARVDEMGDRKREMRGVVRKVAPSVEHPLNLLIVDELAAVTKYMGDKKRQAEAERLLGLLATQGRALAEVAHFFAQEPTKEIAPIRALIPYKIAMRLDTPNQVDMTLGEGAWLRGAWADRIPVSTPGVSYVVQEGVREPLRVRSGFTSDEEIGRLAANYAPGNYAG